MEYHILKDLDRDVRIALDENAVAGELLTDADPDTLTLEEIILSRIPVAARIVETIAPLQLLGWGESFADRSIAWEQRPGYGAGAIVLPDDFHRLLSFRMSDWDRAVSSVITESDEAYQVQRSRFQGLRGNPQKPVCALVNTPTGLALEFYSCTAGAGTYIRTARYMPMPKVRDGMICFPMEIRPAVVYYTAYLTATILAQRDAAAHLLETATQLLQLQDGR